LSNPWTVAVNAISGTAFNFQHFGAKAGAAGTWEMLRRPFEAIEDAYRRGLWLQDDLMSMVRDAEALASPGLQKLQEASGALLKASGYNLSEEMVRAHDWFGKPSCGTVSRTCRPKPDGAGAARIFGEFVKRHGQDLAALVAENGEGPATDRFFRRSVNEIQFGYDVSAKSDLREHSDRKVFGADGKMESEMTRAIHAPRDLAGFQGRRSAADPVRSGGRGARLHRR
jgi:hypothetical protein